MNAFIKKYKKTIILSLSGLGIVGLSAIAYRIIKSQQGKKSEQDNENQIATLHPKIRNKVRKLLDECKKKLGYDLRIYSAFRTFDQQNKLYEQGRTTPGLIVTNARGGESMHNFALATDLVERTKGFNIDYAKIYEIAKPLGFSWGKILYPTLNDQNHFEINYGYSTKQLLEKVKAGKVKNGFVDL